MSIMHFQGATPGQQVRLDALSFHALVRYAASTTSVSAGIKFKGDGSVWETEGDGFAVPSDATDLSPNYYPPGSAGLEVRLTVVSGSGPNGGGMSAGTWYALSSTRHAYQTLTGTGLQVRSGVWRFEIRRGSTIVATSADFTVSVTLDI